MYPERNFAQSKVPGVCVFGCSPWLVKTCRRQVVRGGAGKPRSIELGFFDGNLGGGDFDYKEKVVEKKGGREKERD